MINRVNVGLAAVFLAALSLVASPVVAAEKVTWNMSLWGKPRAWTKGIEAMSEEVSNKTGGNFTIKVHYGGLSKPKENLDGIKMGAFQMAVFCASYHPGKTPTLSASDLPFLPIANLDVQEKVTEVFFQHPAVVADLARWNAKHLFTGILPQYEFMGVGDPPRTLGDWDGKRVRALGGIGKAMKKLGAVPTTVPATETYQLLERGAVDAVSWPFTYAHAAYKVNEISKWFTGNMSPGAVTCPYVMNTKAWNKLPAEYQDVLIAAKPVAYAALKAGYRKADAKNLPAFRASMEEIRYTADELANFRKIGAKPVWDEWVSSAAAKGVPAQELLDLILATAGN